jgi:hypothetical protein
MAVYQLIDAKTYGTLFEIDLEQDDAADLEIQWTDKPIEDGSEASRFGVTKPNVYSVGGALTETPFDQGFQPTRIQDSWGRLESLAKKKQPLVALMGYLDAEVVIQRVGGRSTSSDGKTYFVNLSMKTIRVGTQKSVDIPPARMKKKVKKRASKAKKGGAQSAKTPEGSTKKAAKTRALKALIAASGGNSNVLR